VYCVSCLPSLNEEALKCDVCGSLHPGSFPNVCLDLDHFLEEYFPAEYESRGQKVQSKKGQCNREGSSSGEIFSPSSIPLFFPHNMVRWLSIKCPSFMEWIGNLYREWDWMIPYQSFKLFLCLSSQRCTNISLLFQFWFASSNDVVRYLIWTLYYMIYLGWFSCVLILFYECAYLRDELIY
jgi:hypothetical protein